MNKAELRTTIVRSFVFLRLNGMELGMRELLAAIKLLERGWLKSSQRNARLASTDPPRPLKLLWCKNETEEWQLARVWKLACQEQVKSAEPETVRPQLQEPLQTPLDSDTAPIGAKGPVETSGEEYAPELNFLPFRPSITLTAEMATVELQSYWPVSRRYMAYSWRFLRRPTYAGYGDTLDMVGTVDEVARTGFFVRPIYERRTVNRARVLLLLDQRGSMMPFHRYLRDLTETLSESNIDQENRAVYYFENVPGAHLFLSPYLTEPVAQENVLRFVDQDTGVIIVSDAGAARGRQRNRERLRATLRFWFALIERTRWAAWLNPMPQGRWEETTAEAIAATVPMFTMNEQGLSQAIDFISGRGAASNVGGKQ